MLMVIIDPLKSSYWPSSEPRGLHAWFNDLVKQKYGWTVNKQTYHKPQWIVSLPTWSIEGRLSSWLLSKATQFTRLCWQEAPLYGTMRRGSRDQKGKFLPPWNAERLLPVLPAPYHTDHPRCSGRNFSDSIIDSVFAVRPGNQEGSNHQAAYEPYKACRCRVLHFLCFCSPPWCHGNIFNPNPTSVLQLRVWVTPSDSSFSALKQKELETDDLHQYTSHHDYILHI